MIIGYLTSLPSLLRKLAVEVFVLVALELGYEVDLVYLVEALLCSWLLFVLEKGVDWN